MPVSAGRTNEVALGRIKTNVTVGVGEDVAVLRGVGVIPVGRAEGKAAAVCVDAALAVCAMNVFTAPGSSVGMGAATVGTHASINARATSKVNNLFLSVAILLWLNLGEICSTVLPRYSTMIATYG